MGSVCATNTSWKSSDSVSMLAFSQEFLNRFWHSDILLIESRCSILNEGMEKDSMYISTDECTFFKVVECQSSIYRDTWDSPSTEGTEVKASKIGIYVGNHLLFPFWLPLLSIYGGSCRCGQPGSYSTNLGMNCMEDESANEMSGTTSCIQAADSPHTESTNSSELGSSVWGTLALGRQKTLGCLFLASLLDDSLPRHSRLLVAWPSPLHQRSSRMLCITTISRILLKRFALLSIIISSLSSNSKSSVIVSSVGYRSMSSPPLSSQFRSSPLIKWLIRRRNDSCWCDDMMAQGCTNHSMKKRRERGMTRMQY